MVLIRILEAPVVIALFTDTDLQKRARKDCAVSVGWATDEQLQYYAKISCWICAMMPSKQVITWLWMPVLWLWTWYCFDGPRHWNNIILGFDKEKINEVLDIEERFRPGILITVGYAAEASYRLLVDEIIDKLSQLANRKIEENSWQQLTKAEVEKRRDKGWWLTYATSWKSILNVMTARQMRSIRTALVL